MILARPFPGLNCVDPPWSPGRFACGNISAPDAAHGISMSPFLSAVSGAVLPPQRSDAKTTAASTATFSGRVCGAGLVMATHLTRLARRSGHESSYQQQIKMVSGPRNHSFSKRFNKLSYAGPKLSHRTLRVGVQ